MGAFLLQNWRKIMAKRKKVTLTPNQKEYAKQLKRIKQFIRRAEKRGYIFEDNVIPETPKRITKKSIQKIRDIKPKNLYEKAKAVDYETGEILTGVEARKIERKSSAKKAAETRKKNKASKKPAQQETYYPSFTDIIISNYRVHIRQFNENASSLLENWLDKIIATHGRDDTAIMLNDGAENGHIITYQIVYKHDALLQYMSAMLNYLPEAGVVFEEQLMDAIETMEDWESPE